MELHLINKIAVTFELVGGRKLSDLAAEVIIADLEKYEPHILSRALDRCRNECKGSLSASDIHSRIEDGRPSPNEAWGMIPAQNGETVVWTDEMCQAMSVAWPLMHDKVAARMAFLEKYKKLIDKSRADGVPVKWSVSLGDDVESRLPILNMAILDGKITENDAMKALPAAACPVTGAKQLAGGPSSQKSHLPPDVQRAIGESKKRMAELLGNPSKWALPGKLRE